ncbi:hypothetical protein SAMN05216388_101786 [Halorientalis persicus]|uniref:Phage tail sheath protein n=1 Tax=Halorientalis persicus TaxID=1367881 RepID=A0A1H8RZB9_9EURY|nr:hypothetical protein [Halorientalis persicus]SEO71554.1 hypothetical protein SAMN05216388_101786 [Halorientalis persicus]
MAIYGNTSRVSVDVSGGAITAVNIGDQDKLVIFARGDPNSGTAQTNDPTQVSGPQAAAAAFGEDTALTEAIRDAAANGVGYASIWGVMPATQSATGEAIAGGSGTLGNTPIIEDVAEITATNTTDGVEADVAFRYNDPVAEPSSEQTVHINPFEGIVEAGDSDEYEIDYKWLDWQSAFDAATGVIQEQEHGEWRVHSEAESVVADAISTVRPLRESEWKMIRVSAAAQPNTNSSATPPEAHFDATGYTDGLDNDALFLTAPERRPGSDSLVGGAVAGQMAGTSIDEPILGNALTGVTDLTQTLTVPEQTDLANSGVIPISASGSPALEDNVSTSTETDWTRDFFTARLRDQLVLTARAIGRAARGRLNNDTVETLVQERLADELIDLIEDGVLEPNTDDETRWYTNAEQDATNPKKLDISFGFSPVGVVGTVDVDMTINI